jgi:hypothetical protein
MKSARPCTITERLLFSITFGSTVNAGGGLASPFGKTSISVHNVQLTLVGAWIAFLTSSRSKYSGETWVWKNDPLVREYSTQATPNMRGRGLTGSPTHPTKSATMRMHQVVPKNNYNKPLTISKI